MQNAGFSEDLRLAHLLADQADSISMARFRALDLDVTTKPDLTPVTDADLAVEQALRQTLSTARSRDGIVGEEQGEAAGSGADDAAPRRWIIDPIDGTKNFVRGVPVWATLIALEVDGEVVMGCVSAPALGRRWWAARGTGAFAGRNLTQATRLSVSGVADLADASLSYSEVGEWVESGHGRGFVELLRSVWRSRAYGDFWSYVLVAEGAIDIAGEPELALHDMAALAPIVTEAGGRFTDVAGTDGVRGAGAVATNGLLHDAVLDLLAPDRDAAGAVEGVSAPDAP